MLSFSRSLCCKSALLFTGTVFLGGCMVGPDYIKAPDTEVPTGYKETKITEAQAKNWRKAQPRDDARRGEWWKVYHDPQLDALEVQVNISNQNVLQAEAQFRQAAAAVKVARAAFYPTVSTSPSFVLSGISKPSNGEGGGTVSGGGGSVSGNFSGGSGGSSSTSTAWDFPLDASYMVDVWGAVRRNVEANSAAAQASFADLENIRLSYQATLAEDYFSLRGLDAQEKLLQETVDSYQKYLDLTTNRYNSGVASKGDVAQAQTQLDTTRAQLIDLGIARAQYEHAIATLIGKPASVFALKKAPLTATPPAIPAGVPSELLERRPDIAAAERRVASANASIGVAVSAYYPSITLTGNSTATAIHLSEIFSGPTFIWSVGPALAQTLFNGGATHGQVQEAQANYDSTVAAYRQVVLTAFQQIEDNLAGLRILANEAEVTDKAVQSAQQSLDIATNNYKAGTQDYLTVITTQTTVLNNKLNAVTIRSRRMTTSVLLIMALGGDWDVSKLPGRAGVADVPQAEQDIVKGKPAAKK